MEGSHPRLETDTFLRDLPWNKHTFLESYIHEEKI